MLRNIQAEGKKFVCVKTFAIFADLVHLVLNEARSYGILIRCLQRCSMSPTCNNYVGLLSSPKQTPPD